MAAHVAGRVSFGIRERILRLFAFNTAVLLAAVAYGFFQFSASVDVFVTDVKASQANALEALAIETNFKKQVQEWKNVLLRGKTPEAFDKHWNEFQQLESDVRRASERMKAAVTDAVAGQLIGQFVVAHEQMDEAYRRGLQAFRDHGFDGAAGDVAVAGIDRTPTELLSNAKERFIAIADEQARQAADGAHRTAWMIGVLLAVSAIGGAAAFMTALSRTISRP